MDKIKGEAEARQLFNPVFIDMLSNKLFALKQFVVGWFNHNSIKLRKTDNKHRTSHKSNIRIWLIEMKDTDRVNFYEII